MDASQKAQLVKELRERTGSGFLDVKKALEATNYDIEKAIEFLKDSGKAKAAKKAGRIAAEGLVSVVKNDKKVVIFEVNSETDFVATNQQFIDLVKNIGQALLANDFTNLESALAVKIDANSTILQATENATATIGEKISLRRAEFVNLEANQVAGIYTHANGRVSSLLLAEGTNETNARNVAMHIAAMNPEFLSKNEVPANRLEKLTAEFKESPSLKGKPEKIQENILSGMLNKALAEFTLLNQPFVMDQGFTVEKYLTDSSLKALKMKRFEVGEGIEKEVVDFAAEVAAQMKK
ncbi:translation elongation factor Ts [Mycoplasmopsis agassizii]|uniref:Elongation factor Ts n=1 Tax=Mycoplasmopsis agassizii TaxID=33922 RepID=A0ABX4H5V2_9BACT|nr:translation elongation factor Ts [Mycoplasmopsis agassizii]PAF55261.1 elongation factor Ts [Mycoplasmopsis agassizii]SMC15679.1 translation elongation factor Ts (EF-Ts) [Mycoplasmopsis agassizii]